MWDYYDFFNIYIMGSIQILTGFYFFTKFLGKKAHLIYYVLFTAIMLIPAGRIIDIFVYILLLAVSGIYICKSNSATAVLYAIVTVEIMQFCYGGLNSVLCILYPFMASFDFKIAGTIFIVLGFVPFLVSILCYRAVYKHFLYAETDKNKYTLTILIPTLMIFLTGQYINSRIYGNTITLENNRIVGDENHYLMFLIQLLGITSLFCILFAYKKLLEDFQLNTALSLLEQEEHFLYQYVREAKERYEKTRAFRHDIKNHITIVKELLANDKSEQALNYIGGMEGIMSELSFPCNTNHPTVDILLANKLGIAENSGIHVHCSLLLPYPCAVNDIDFCIILSNALDNAINACKKMNNNTQKYIHITGSTQGDFLLIEVKNSFQGNKTLKKGTGLTNICSVAEKYHGTVNMKMQDNTFLLNVLLVIPQQAERISQHFC